MSRLVLSLALTFGLCALGAPDGGRERPRIAVLYFQSAGGSEDVAAFTKGLAALLISDLTQVPGIDVVERERLEDVLGELKLGRTEFADKGSFAQIGRLLGARYYVTGTMVGFKGRYRLVARVILNETGQEAGAASATITDDDVFAAEQALVKDLAAVLLKEGLLTGAAAAPKRDYKLPLSTATKYARALDAKDKKDAEKAKALLTQVVAEQPKFQLAQLDRANLTR